MSYTQVGAGADHTCGLRSDGSIVCWGYNNDGQITVPVLPAGVSYIQVSSGGQNNCALRSDGSIVCWGLNADGQNTVPALPAGLSYTQVRVAGMEVCALRSDGSLVCWGNNTYGQTTVPALPAGLTYTQAISGGGYNCGLRSDGSLVCWGYNAYGQTIVPALPAGLSYIYVSASGLHTCGLRSDGSLVCWGAGTTNTGVDPELGQSIVPPLPAGVVYGIDTIPPIVNSITRGSTNPTGSSSVSFTIIFSEYVTGVDTVAPFNNFVLTTSTGITGASITGVTPVSGTTYTVTVNTGTGNGTLRLDVPVTATNITDIAGNLLGDLPFTGGEEYIIAKTAPVLLLPLNGATLHYNRPTFDWSDFSGATGYQIQVSKNSTFTLLVVNTNTTAANSTYTPTSNLPANTLLYWRVRAKLGTAKSAWSSVWTLHTGSPPSIPSLLAPADNALIKVLTPLLDWAKSSGATFDHYQIQLADNADFTGAVDENIAGVANHAYTPTVALNTNTKYYWHVRAWNTGGDYSAWSALRTFRESMLPPGLVDPISGITVGDRKPVFDWDDVAGATKYTLQVSTNSSFTSLVLNLNVTPSTYAPISNLAANKPFYWRVKALGPNGPSAWSTVETFHTP